MRIAVCFFGLHPSECWKDKTPLNDLSHVYWKKNVFDRNDNVDIFLHSWSINNKDKLINEYNPTTYKIEHQKDFSNKNHMKSRSEEHILNRFSVDIFSVFNNLLPKSNLVHNSPPI